MKKKFQLDLGKNPIQIRKPNQISDIETQDPILH